MIPFTFDVSLIFLFLGFPICKKYDIIQGLVDYYRIGIGSYRDLPVEAQEILDFEDKYTRKIC